MQKIQQLYNHIKTLILTNNEEEEDKDSFFESDANDNHLEPNESIPPPIVLNYTISSLTNVSRADIFPMEDLLPYWQKNKDICESPNSFIVYDITDQLGSFYYLSPKFKPIKRIDYKNLKTLDVVVSVFQPHNVFYAKEITEFHLLYCSNDECLSK